MDNKIARIGEDLTSRLDNEMEVIDRTKILRKDDFIKTGNRPSTVLLEDVIDEALYV